MFAALSTSWHSSKIHKFILNHSGRLLSLSFREYDSAMREIARWIAVLLIAVTAASPIFEVFDKTDGFAQDISDLARYALCLFCFLTFALRRMSARISKRSFLNSAG